MTKRGLSIIAWTVTLLVSVLPAIVVKELFKTDLSWLLWAQIGLLAILLGAALLVKPLRPLWMYFAVLLVLFLSEWFFNEKVGDLFAWYARFGMGNFTKQMLGTQLLRLFAALTMVLFLFILKRRPSAFYLVSGNLSAEAAPIPLLMSKPSRWNKLGWILSLCISGGTLLFLVLASQPSLETLGRLLPFLPAVLGLALMNSFSEELSYRAGPLATLHEAVGPQQALLMTAALFGIGHYYGVPYGIVGVLMAGFLGWLLGKSMLETKGFAWAWFIHFLQDVLIFSFMAIGSVMAGG
jgi:hypothetical protein